MQPQPYLLLKDQIQNKLGLKQFPFQASAILSALKDQIQNKLGLKPKSVELCALSLAILKIKSKTN